MPHSSAVCSWTVRSRQLADQLAAFEGADGDVGVACVESQQHVRLPQESGYRFHRPVRTIRKPAASRPAVVPSMIAVRLLARSRAVPAT